MGKQTLLASFVEVDGVAEKLAVHVFGRVRVVCGLSYFSELVGALGQIDGGLAVLEVVGDGIQGGGGGGERRPG